MKAESYWNSLLEQIREGLVRGQDESVERALTHLEEGCREETDPLPPQRALAEALFMMDRYDPAVAVCEAILSVASNDSRAHELLSQVYYFQERYEPALRHAEKALLLDPTATMADGVRRHVRKKMGLETE